MFDLFPECREEGYYSDNRIKNELFVKDEEDSITLDACRGAMDITSIEVLEELGKLNPYMLLPHLLPLNKELKQPEETISDIFNKEGTQFLHIQMPNSLPSIDKMAEVKGDGKENKMEEEGTTRVYQSSKLECLPSGKLGKLRVHKSGKIKLHIDGHEFNFSRGNGSTCKQEVAFHLEPNNEFFFLGNFQNRFVVSPDLSGLGKDDHT